MSWSLDRRCRRQQTWRLDDHGLHCTAAPPAAAGMTTKQGAADHSSCFGGPTIKSRCSCSGSSGVTVIRQFTALHSVAVDNGHFQTKATDTACISSPAFGMHTVHPLSLVTICINFFPMGILKVYKFPLLKQRIVLEQEYSNLSFMNIFCTSY